MAVHQYKMILDINNIHSGQLAAIDSEGGRLTYGELTDFACFLQKQFIQRELCFLLTGNDTGGIKWAIGMIGSQKLVPLILNEKTDTQLLNNLIDTYQPAYICCHDSNNKLQERFTDATEIINDKGYKLLKTGFSSPELFADLSHLLPTSGSTGSPKLVRHCYDNIEAAALNISTFFELKSADRPLMVLPLYYTMGLSIVFSHFKVGATILITGRNMTDAVFWQFMKSQKATSFTGVPYSFQILDMMRFFRMDMPDLELLTQGGGKMEKNLNLKFAQWCQEKGKRWIATYGQSECTARMAYLPAKWAVEKVGSIGIAMPNGELSLIDANGNSITTPHTEGEMCYRGRNVTMGYATCREDMNKGDERHGFIKTGDLAYFDEDGCYYIVGRLGRFIKLFGMRVGLDECEQIIASECKIESACVGTDEKMIVYITDADKTTLVKQTLIDKTHIVATSFEIRVIEEIPKNEAGKKLYSKL